MHMLRHVLALGSVMYPKFLVALSLLVAAGMTQTAVADGYFLQADVGGQTQSLVGSAAHGPFSFGANLTDYAGGRSGATTASYGYALSGAVTFKVGPTIGFTKEDGRGTDVDAGARVAIDRWSATSFGSTYWLAEASTPQQSWFLLGQMAFAPVNIGIELSRGGSDTYHETTLALQRRIGEGQVSLRLGYKLSSDEVFAGFSINTF